MKCSKVLQCSTRGLKLLPSRFTRFQLQHQLQVGSVLWPWTSGPSGTPAASWAPMSDSRTGTHQPMLDLKEPALEALNRRSGRYRNPCGSNAMLDLGELSAGNRRRTRGALQRRSEKLEDGEGSRGSFSQEEGARGPREQAVSTPTNGSGERRGAERRAEAPQDKPSNWRAGSRAQLETAAGARSSRARDPRATTTIKENQINSTLKTTTK